MTNSHVDHLNFISSNFNFVIVKQNSDLLSAFDDRLRYLITVESDYLQYIILNEIKIDRIFYELCEIEIAKIRSLYELQPFNSASIYNSPGSNTNNVKKVITDMTYDVDISHYKYIFISEKDYFLYLTVFSSFFSGLPLPSDFRINCHLRSKTKFKILIKDIYCVFCTIPIRKNFPFLAILKKINLFEKYSDIELTSLLTKHKQVA